MFTNRKLPDSFLDRLHELETSYLKESDPIRQSGFGGGAIRWRAEREPILDAITDHGEILDIGCANGYLVKCLVDWANEKGLNLIPYGIDCSVKLIDIAKHQNRDYKNNFYVGNAWNFRPPRKFKYVYSLYDCVPLDLLDEYIRRLMTYYVAENGLLIIGAYGSLSKNLPSYDIISFLKNHKWQIAGESESENPPITRFAWVKN